MSGPGPALSHSGYPVVLVGWGGGGGPTKHSGVSDPPASQVLCRSALNIDQRSIILSQWTVGAGRRRKQPLYGSNNSVSSSVFPSPPARSQGTALGSNPAGTPRNPEHPFVGKKAENYSFYYVLQVIFKLSPLLFSLILLAQGSFFRIFFPVRLWDLRNDICALWWKQPCIAPSILIVPTLPMTESLPISPLSIAFSPFPVLFLPLW